MLFLKYSLIFFNIVNAYGMFDDDQCFRSHHNVKVTHSTFPFNLAPTELEIDKKDCLIKFTQTNYYIIKKVWAIDICREPVHIKYGRSGQEVIRKNEICSKTSFDPNNKDKFCHYYTDLEKVIQDDGLIFAEGEKESLTSEHGKVYCSYSLIKKYLKDDFIFNRSERYFGLLFPQKIEQKIEEQQQLPVEEPIAVETPITELDTTQSPVQVGN